MKSVSRAFAGKGWRYACLVGALSVIQLILFYSIAPVSAWAFGQNIPYIDGVILMAFVQLGIFISPTPSGSGVAEAGFSLLFATLISGPALLCTVGLWRFLSGYSRIIAGAVCIFFENDPLFPLVQDAGRRGRV